MLDKKWVFWINALFIFKKEEAEKKTSQSHISPKIWWQVNTEILRQKGAMVLQNIIIN